MSATQPTPVRSAERSTPATSARVGSAGGARRLAYLFVGWASVVFGVIGIVVPLWPTTCFLLLAGWCFARSSRRAERWLYGNRLFGRYLTEYRDHGVISHQIRRASIATLWLVLGISALVFWSRLWVIALLLLVGTAVSIHLLSLPTAVEDATPR